METYRQESYGQENYRQESYSRAAYKKPGRRMNTARIMLYTFLSFVLSLIFFVLIVTLLSVGLGTLIIWIGIPILLVAFAMSLPVTCAISQPGKLCFIF
jgi:small neutral amino acid transporter SnatA (MarC family)